jgi:hypothetical protein
MTENMRERRGETRLLCADLVQVRWTDSGGKSERAAAVLEDIAQSGACLQFESPVPVDAMLHIKHDHGELKGIVRYCEYRDIGYFVGIAFAPAHGWSRTEFEPAHLLDWKMPTGRRGGA